MTVNGRLQKTHSLSCCLFVQREQTLASCLSSGSLAENWTLLWSEMKCLCTTEQQASICLIAYNSLWKKISNFFFFKKKEVPHGPSASNVSCPAAATAPELFQSQLWLCSEASIPLNQHCQHCHLFCCFYCYHYCFHTLENVQKNGEKLVSEKREHMKMMSSFLKKKCSNKKWHKE